jgi:methylenetetrahydrofolate reductase (NADPH)
VTASGARAGGETAAAAPGGAGAPGGGAAAAGAASLARLLRNARFEVLPLDGIEEQVVAHLAPGSKVTVTASPRRGLDATLEVAERLTAGGYSTVPHLSARLVRNSAHLGELLDRVLAAGVKELFVLAGDAAEPAGEFSGAEELLVAMGERRSEFDAIGITGYPESHHLISDEETIRAMFAKAPMATHIVSQICFDAATIESWIAEVRRRGTDLPIWIGLPGHVAYAKLMRVSLKIGLGESARYLRHHRSWMARLLTRQFKPDRLIRDLDPCVTNPSNRVAGFHLYTFNEVGRTERWRRAALARLGG